MAANSSQVAPFPGLDSSPEPVGRAAPGRELVECAALGLFALTVFFFHLGSYRLWEPDEARYAEIAREMLARGNYVVPHLNYVPYIEKPPLLYWLTSLSFHFLGLNEFAARIVPALAAMFGVLATYWFGRRAFDHRRALLAGAILTTSPLYAAMAQVLTTDMLLTAMLSAAFFAIFLQWREGGNWWIVLYLAAGLAVLTKGPVGVILPVLVAVAFAWRDGGLGSGFSRLHPIAGGLILSAVAIPWFAIVTIRLSGFAHFYFVGEHLRRFFVSSYSHGEPIYFYVPVLVAGMLPWSICFPLILKYGTQGPARSLCAIAAVSVLAPFSLASAKLIPYILPALPPIAILLADSILSAAGRAPARQSWRFTTDRIMALMGPGLGLAGIAAIALGAGASRIANPYLIALSSVLIGVGALILIGGSAAFAAFARGRIELGVALVAVSAGAAIIAASNGRIRLDPFHSWWALSREIAIRAPDSTLICYHRYPQAVPFYTHRRVVFVGHYRSELGFGADHSPDRDQFFLESDADLAKRWAKERAAVLIIDQTDLQRLGRELGEFQEIASQGRKRAVMKVPQP